MMRPWIKTSYHTDQRTGRNPGHTGTVVPTDMCHRSLCLLRRESTTIPNKLSLSPDKLTVERCENLRRHIRWGSRGRKSCGSTQVFILAWISLEDKHLCTEYCNKRCGYSCGHKCRRHRPHTTPLQLSLMEKSLRLRWVSIVDRQPSHTLDPMRKYTRIRELSYMKSSFTLADLFLSVNATTVLGRKAWQSELEILANLSLI